MYKELEDLMLFCFVSDVTLNKKAKQQVAETMMSENKKQEPSKDVHLQALKIFINLFPKGISICLRNVMILVSFRRSKSL